MYIYNSHQEELTNEDIMTCYNQLNLNRFIQQIKIFNYDPSIPKTTAQDIASIRDYVLNNYNHDDRVLLLKSDCVLSKHYFQDIYDLPKDRYVYYTAPFVCAKERITNDEIIEYCLRDKFIRSDDITFFIEDMYQSSDSDFTNRPDIKPTDKQIKFTSCCTIRDWSCHLISLGIIGNIEIHQCATWGGIHLQSLAPYFIETHNSFVVHKYHDINSDNRHGSRQGPVEEWLIS